MAETGDLIIKIGGDASKFKATIADVENSLKSFKANLGNTGLNIKIEALGFQETKSNIKSVTDFAEGTLGAVKNTIKEINQQRLSISADPNALAPFNIKLNELKTSVKELEQAGILKNVPVEVKVAENSIQGLSNKLTELRKQRAIIDPDTNARAILQINQQIDKLQQKIVNLNNLGQKIDTGTGLIGGFNGIKKGSAEAGRALTSLSLVAQDLPFGFIGIQNNLPAVIQSFGQLKASAPAAGGALKALGSALVGPAGLFLAFSAVTGAVTFAIQKYGSLGAAYDALVGKIDPLAKIISTVNDDLENFNKGFLTTDQAIGKATASTEAQIIKVRQLSQAVLDTTKSENTRKFALQQLKSIDEARFGRYDVEKGKLAGLEQSVQSYTRAIIANSVAQKLSDRAGDALIARNSALALFTAQEKAVNSLIEKFPDVQRQAKKYADDLIRTQGQLGQRPIAAPEVLDFAAASDKLEIYRKQLQDINAVYRQTRTEAIAATDESIKFGEALAEATKSTKGRGTTDKETKELNSALKKEEQYWEKYFKLITEGYELSIEITKSFFKTLREESEKNRKERFEFTIGKSLGSIQIPNNFPEVKIPLSLDGFEGQEEFTKELELALQAASENFKKSSELIDQLFFNPISQAFDDFLEKGKFSFKSFADEALKQIRRVVAGELTKKLLALLSNVLFPGTGAAVGAALKNINTEALGSWLDFYDGVKAPNLSGINGGGMQMSGSVNLVLRGSDLVGSLNRTNATINRVG